MQPLPCITMFLLIAGESILSLLAKVLTSYYKTLGGKKKKEKIPKKQKEKKKKRRGRISLCVCVCRKYILNIKQGKMVPREKKANMCFDSHNLKHGLWCVGNSCIIYGHYHPIYTVAHIGKIC